MSKELGFIQKLTRLYTFYSPIRKGKYRLAEASLKLAGEVPRQVLARTKDGRTLRVNFDNHFAHFLYFIGEYERAITEIIEKLIEPGDICLDIGANIGWFTTLFQKLVGENGAVHSFEPVPPTFKVLEENVKSNVNSRVVRINNVALGDREDEVSLHLFPDRSDGHASVSNFGETAFEEFRCRQTTLDSYLTEKGISGVKFVKADIEGAELFMLRGAGLLFEQKIPPIFEIEMALDTTRGFGYLPNDIVDFMRQKGDFEFYAIEEPNGGLKKIKGFEPDQKGANVLCRPTGEYERLFRKLNVK
ncbi:MAG: FkbM family methyltransferase [Pyrinomonadaceae bacterium]